MPRKFKVKRKEAKAADPNTVENVALEKTSAEIPEKSLVEQYLEQMSEQERIVLEIAKQTLKSSFNIKKSIGFMNFVEKMSPQNT